MIKRHNLPKSDQYLLDVFPPKMQYALNELLKKNSGVNYYNGLLNGFLWGAISFAVSNLLVRFLF